MDSVRGLAPTLRRSPARDTALQEEGGPIPATQAMKPFIQTAMVFAGTLAAATLVALGEPAQAEVQMVVQAPPPEMVAGLFGIEAE